MISPPVTVWPANVFTPRRFALESRPLRLEPRPFLCAILSRLLRGFRFRAGRFRGFARGALTAERDVDDLDARQLLAVAGTPFVAALGLELYDAQLLAALGAEDLPRDPPLLEALAVEDRLLGAIHQRRQLHVGALLGRQALDEKALATLDAVLLAAGLHDRVHIRS